MSAPITPTSATAVAPWSTPTAATTASVRPSESDGTRTPLITLPSNHPDSLLIQLDARPDLAEVERLPRGPERKQAAWNALVATAKESQRPLVELAERLRKEGVVKSWESLASPNMLIVEPVRGKSSAVLDAFRGAEGVTRIFNNSSGLQQWPRATGEPGIGRPIVDEPAWGLDVVDERPEIVEAPDQRPYGIEMVGAPAAWKQGATGAGLVYGSIDTGVDPSHESIAERYRGRREDGTFEHDYNWFDPKGRSAEARDFHGHGTHTIGTVVGRDVGVAPQASFVAVAGLTGTAAGPLKALQWMLAPTRVDGSDPDPTRAPDVVGMSWWTGNSDEDLFHDSIRNLRAAGIEPVKSAGNRGPAAGSISSPGQFPEIVSTAAVDARGDVARFSSRGPAPWPKGSSTPKPDIAAPGVDVVSALPGGRYGRMSGTSMAQPHASGAILAVLSRYPELSGEQLRQALAAGAVDRGAPGFDAEYGYGIVNIPAALAAAKLLLEQQRDNAPTAPADPAATPAATAAA